MTEAKAFRTNIKVTLHKTLIRSVMACDCSTLEFAADTYS
jgi:hypothetical protein